MKRIIFIALLLFTVHCSLLTATAQSRTNRLTRPCPGSTTPATVSISVAGNITLTPCAGGTVTINGVKVYRALLTQSGTNAPVATVLENTLGGTVVWTRTNAGDYTGTLTGGFPSQTKTWLSPSGLDGAAQPLAVYWTNANSVRVFANDGDGVLSLTSIEIRVYP